MSLFPYTGPMTTDDIFADVYRRSNRSLSCRDRMCGAYLGIGTPAFIYR
jgi:hypothetical protein